MSAAKKFSISISYPPLESIKGTPFLGQNRQFQWTNTGNVILPVIPAIGATLLKKNGYKVYWDDAIAEKLSYQQWLKRILKLKPNLIFIETKTPVVKKHWQIIKELKQKSLKIKKYKLKIVLMGDHATALPQESLENSPVDYIITGGDYDFMMLSLANHLTKNTPLEPGFFSRNTSSSFGLKHHNLDSLPLIDRKLTNWQIYSKNNTNFKYHPGAYTMFGRDCWWGKCTFCSWTTTHPFGTFRVCSVNHAIAEIKYLVSIGIKEIFDDTGTFPVGEWLNDFCQQMISTGLNKKVVLGCNMRFAALNQQQYHLMKQAGFRFILYGLESSNQSTLDKIKKNTKVSDSRSTLVMAKNAGLEPHLTIMVGYPWETKKQAQKTLSEARQLFKDGLADSMQATLIIPYPGTPLFDYCQKNDLLLTTDWEKYDMRQPIMKTVFKDYEIMNLIQNLFKGILTPKFIIRKIFSIRNHQDFLHLTNYTIKYLKKLRDFQ